MATKTLYWKDAVPTGATAHRSLQDGGVAPTGATIVTGWVAGTKATGQACLQQGGVEVTAADASWGTTLQPSAAPTSTTGDSWRSELPFDGTFANANWTFTFGFRSVTGAYTGRYKIAVRVWASRDRNGVGAVELTGARQASAATTAAMVTNADTVVTVTWSPGATISLLGQYLFVNVGIEVTSSGSGTTQDVDWRVGSAYTVATPDFTPTPLVNAPTFAPQRNWSFQPADSTHGTPKTLTQEVDPPVGDSAVATFGMLLAVPLLALGAVFVPPNLVVNTAASVDTVARAPVYVARRELPQQWLSDTTLGTPPVLSAVTTPAPVVVAPLFGPLRAAWQPADATQATPKTLIEDGQAPVGVAAPAGYAQHGRAEWLNPDTGQGAPAPLLAAVAPFVPALHLALPRLGWQPPDGSAGTPKPLIADAQAPVSVLAHQSPARSGWQPANTAQSAQALYLAAAALPPGAKALDSAPVLPRALVETTRGTAKPLIADAQLPAGLEAPHVEAQPRRTAPWLNGDTSLGTPKSLTPDGQLPVFVAPHFTLAQHGRAEWLPADTARPTPAPLLAVVPAPIANVPPFAPLRFWWQPADSSTGTPKALRADAQAPVFVAAPVIQSQHGKSEWLPGDSSTGMAAVLRAVVVPPFVPAPHAVPIKYVGQTADGTRGSPKPLLVDAQAPTFVAAHVAPPRFFWQPADSSTGSAKGLTLDAQAPFANLAQTPPDRVRPVVDTARSTVIALPLPVPVGGSVQLGPLRVAWQPADGSRGTPKVATADQQLPVFDAAHFTQAQHSRNDWLAPNTSQGTAATLRVVVVAPVADVPHLPPHRTRWQPLDTSLATPKSALADKQLPVFVAAHQPPPRFFWQPPDGSRGTPKGLLAETQAPVPDAPSFAPLRFWWQPSDSSAGTPKGLLADARLPVFVAAHFVQAQHGRGEWLPADTSQGSPAALLVPVAPLVDAPQFAALRHWWQPPDASAGTPQVLRPDAQAPFFVVAHLPPLRHWWQPADGSKASPTAKPSLAHGGRERFDLYQVALRADVTRENARADVVQAVERADLIRVVEREDL